MWRSVSQGKQPSKGSIDEHARHLHHYLYSVVNAAPHVGFALELVQADAYARHFRLLGRNVRFQYGTDDNSLKNVRAAESAGLPVADFVSSNAAKFERLGKARALGGCEGFARRHQSVVEGSNCCPSRRNARRTDLRTCCRGALPPPVSPKIGQGTTRQARHPIA